MIVDAHPELRKKGDDRHFWAKGYYVDTVGRNEKEIREYIKNQAEADKRDEDEGGFHIPLGVASIRGFFNTSILGATKY